MFLVDTSVWIDYLREKNNAPVRWFEEILRRGFPYSITSLIYQEVLQGADSEKDFETLERYLRTQVFHNPVDEVNSYREAARIYFDCRRSGVTVRSANDCLIAQVAIEQGLLLLHNDADFTRMAKVVKELQVYQSR